MSRLPLEANPAIIGQNSLALEDSNRGSKRVTAIRGGNAMKRRIQKLFWSAMMLIFLSGCGPLGDLGKGVGDIFNSFNLP
jgi:hypothetical protein